MKNLKNLTGAKELNTTEQKSLLGGIGMVRCVTDHDCSEGYKCVDGGNMRICLPVPV